METLNFKNGQEVELTEQHITGLGQVVMPGAKGVVVEDGNLVRVSFIDQTASQGIWGKMKKARQEDWTLFGNKKVKVSFTDLVPPSSLKLLI